jgi:hypothetical protein
LSFCFNSVTSPPLASFLSFFFFLSLSLSLFHPAAGKPNKNCQTNVSLLMLRRKPKVLKRLNFTPQFWSWKLN